jgi:transposase
MEDVLDVYHRPYNAIRPVVCIDEASKELHSSPRPDLPAKPGRHGRKDYEYAREGTRNLFMTVEPLTGRCSVRVTQRRTYIDYAEHLRWLVDEAYPDAELVVVVNDNLNTHTVACLYEAFGPAEAHRIKNRLEMHYTPEHASWMNVAEIELSILSRQCLARRIADEHTLREETDIWVNERNAEPVKIDWQFTTADARIKLKHLYPERKTS